MQKFKNFSITVYLIGSSILGQLALQEIIMELRLSVGVTFTFFGAAC